jgi:hypothetical protein
MPHPAHRINSLQSSTLAHPRHFSNFEYSSEREAAAVAVAMLHKHPSQQPCTAFA